MSDEEVQEEIATTEEEVAQTSPEEIAQPVEQSQQNEEKKKEKLNKKFRLIKGEEILDYNFRFFQWMEDDIQINFVYRLPSIEKI